MTALHKQTDLPTPKVDKSAFDSLKSYLDELKSKQLHTDFETMEKEIHEYFKAAEQEALSDYLSRYDVDIPVITINGEVYRKVLRCNQEYISAAGPINIERTLYRSQKGEKAISPLELKSGIVEGKWTPGAAKQAIWATSHLTPQESEDLFKQLGNMQPSKSSLDRLPKKLGEHWEESHLDYQTMISAEEVIPEEAVTVGISLDGVMVPMKKQKQEKPDKKSSAKKSEYKEASCGVISFYDNTGERLSTIQFARMPEAKKETLKLQLSLELSKIFDKRPELQLVKIADGAKDNWNYLAKELPEGEELLDFYHMSEYLKNAFDAAYGEGNSDSSAQFDKYKTIMKEDYNGASKVIRALEYLRNKYPKRKKIKAALKYFRNNKHRMNYAKALENNLPIGSGVVEAACKTLVTQRLKRSGMRWANNKGGQAILSFRSLIKSNRFDRAWELLKKKYHEEIYLPENVVAFSR